MKVELLSPARNLACGLAAINYGADAVYIGAVRFGAREAAGNSVQDIETLAKYAHRFRAKVYVALNTVLYDNELDDAERLIWDVYRAGADALIIQDFGILEMDLPPVSLHASTQTDNRNLEKIQFLQNAGFSRVVLARELNLQQINEIRAKIDIELEAFIHGALCTSYSGQCYISQAVCERSANRGQCAQFCRLPYDLLDSNGNVLQKNKHLLSLKDLDLSENIGKMIDAGISSFKIEGRLKDVDYVKNITAFYRKKIDAVLENKPEYKKSSLGKTVFFFEPNPQKTFHRSSTDYFFNGRHTGIYQPETPKSLGEKIGKITFVGKNYFELENAEKLHNGDGLCFINGNVELQGFRVNKMENRKVFPLEMPYIRQKTTVFRNFDAKFDKILEGKSAERKIGIKIEFFEHKNKTKNFVLSRLCSFVLKITDEEKISVEHKIDCETQAAQNPEKAIETLRTQLAKLGNTIYYAENVQINLSQAYFFPISTLNNMRSSAIELLEREREKCYQYPARKTLENTVFSKKTLDYRANITNRLSEQFYRKSGVEILEKGFELLPRENVPLMQCRHCIKYELGFCPRHSKKAVISEPLYLAHKKQRFVLKFDCKNCEMQIFEEHR